MHTCDFNARYAAYGAESDALGARYRTLTMAVGDAHERFGFERFTKLARYLTKRFTRELDRLPAKHGLDTNPA